jgi:hypothetical protein
VVTARNQLNNWITQKTWFFPLLAFLIPFAFRLIPEILMGPYVVGFDTMGFYIPNTLRWLHDGINLASLVSTAPMFYSIYLSLVFLGASPVFTLKIIAPLLLAFLGFSIFYFAKKGIGWSSAKSLFVAVLGTIYFVALRASWDQLREETGLIFFFIMLTVLVTRKERNWKNYVLLFLTMILVVLSHQLVAILMLGVVVCTVIAALLHKRFVDSISLVLASLPAVTCFFIAYLTDVLNSGVLNYSSSGISNLSNWTGFASYPSMLLNAGGFFLYCYILILPFALVGLWRLQNLQLRFWLLITLFLVLLPTASVSPYRWVLMLTYPLAFFATESLSTLKSIHWKRYRLKVSRVALLYLVFSTAILSVGYVTLAPESPFLYFNSYGLNRYDYQIPTSMLQNTISQTDCQDTANVLNWFKNNVNNNSILLTHTAFYSWALLTLNESQIKSYGFNDPEKSAAETTVEGFQHIYLIWWVSGQGWYGEPTLPSSFSLDYSSGRIAIYSYNP